MPDTVALAPKIGVPREVYERLRREAEIAGASIRDIAKWKLAQPFNPNMIPTAPQTDVGIPTSHPLD